MNLVPVIQDIWKHKEPYFTFDGKALTCTAKDASILSEAVKLYQAKNILEVGSYVGYSTVALAKYAETVTCIDDFSECEN